jgi:uncharacterized protein YneF (UPF0154 family)
MFVLTLGDVLLSILFVFGIGTWILVKKFNNTNKKINKNTLKRCYSKNQVHKVTYRLAD